MPAAEDLLAREEAHVEQIDQLDAQLDGLVGKEPRETLPALRDAAALEIEQKTSALEALGPIAKEPRARERLEVEVKTQEIALEGARDDEANARARVEANAVDAEQVAAQAERLAAWREQLAALERRHRVYTATLAAIDDAERATMKTVTRYLEKHMVGDLEAVTDGRYRRVRVDDRTLDIEVMAPEKGDWVKVSALSQGTLDLVYLTARLGLVRLVTGDRRPPLLIDDPFVTLDDARATRALHLLKSVSTDFQVIYLTTSDRYDSAADSVVELPGPTAIDDGESAPEPDPPPRRRPDRRPVRRDRRRDLRAGLGDRLGRRRLRRWPDQPARPGLRRRPHLADRRDGARGRPRARVGESLFTGHGPRLVRGRRDRRRHRDHEPVPRAVDRPDGDRGPGDRRPRGDDPGHRRVRHSRASRTRSCSAGSRSRSSRSCSCLARRGRGRRPVGRAGPGVAGRDRLRPVRGRASTS